MQGIFIDKNGPKAFILASDGRFAEFQPENDQFWALNLEPSEFAPFHLRTTYHLRANSMRVFPNIFINQKRHSKSEDYVQSPTITAYSPSSITIEYNIKNKIFVQFLSFIPEPELLVGALQIKNISNQTCTITAEMAAILIPMEQGTPIHPETIGHNHILSGRTETIYPTLFMSDCPSSNSNPYPVLQLFLTLLPDQTEEIQWALASKKSQMDSFDAARHWVMADCRRELINYQKYHEKNLVFIKTGQPDWDTAFLLSQINAQTHLVASNKADPQSTYIRAHLTDQYSHYHKEKSGSHETTLLNILHLSQTLLPTNVDLLTSLIESFTSQIDDQGCLCFQKVQKSRDKNVNECPLLSSLCLMLYEINSDASFLLRIFPHLRQFFDLGWLKNAKPQEDKIPTWDTAAQLQLDGGLFNFDIWEETGNGLDIHTAHSPALLAMLFREATALTKIAHILGDRSAHNWYLQWKNSLLEKMNSLWMENSRTFSYQDFQTRQTPPREIYFPGRIQPLIKIEKHFNIPQRLQIILTIQGKQPKNPILRLEGKNREGETAIELIQSPELHWVNNRVHITTRQVFSALDIIYFQGFESEDRFVIKTADYTQADISCLLPIWSGGIRKERLSEIMDYLSNQGPLSCEFGISETWRCSHPLPENIKTPINNQWNMMIVDGLAREGLSEKAMDLFTKLMKPILQGLKQFIGFYSLFDDKTGLPIGPANTIGGLIPVALFLKIAGIKLLSPNRLAIWGENPFPWPIEVRWQGLFLRKESLKTDIVFPDGSQYHSQSAKPQIISGLIK